MAQRFLEGEKDPAPKGWTTLANVFSLLALRWPFPPAMVERFSREHLGRDADGESHRYVAAATWSICERVSAVGILVSDGNVQRWTKTLIEPRSPLHRLEFCNEHLNLADGSIGTGCDAAGQPIDPDPGVWGDLAGKLVLLPSKDVAAAMKEFGFTPGSAARAQTSVADETAATKQLLAKLRKHGTGTSSSVKLHQEIAPLLGARAWRRVWDRVAVEFPTIKRPGRKPKIIAPGNPDTNES